MADTTKITSVGIEDREYYTAMVHFYRGELGRIMVWRQRLDMTTNWAVVAATGIITFALSHPEITHVIFLVANIMLFLLLVIEGRRYRYYDAFRARVRMLEVHFLVPVVMRRAEVIEGDWRHLLAEDLLIPSFKIGMCEAIARRLRRNYMWLFGILFASWILKVFVHSGSISSLKGFFIAAQNSQPFSPWIFWLSKILFYGTIIWLTVYGHQKRRASGEMESHPIEQKLWKM